MPSKPPMEPPPVPTPIFGAVRAVVIHAHRRVAERATTSRSRVVVSMPLRHRHTSDAAPVDPVPVAPEPPATVLSDALTAMLDAVRAGAYLCLDSNLWMSPSCYPAITRFLQLLGERGTPLRLSGEQFAEIDKLRKGPRQAEKSLAGRAIRAIADFAELGWLMIDPVADQRAKHDFDSYLVQRARGHLKTRGYLGRVIVVTGDVPLSGRLHSLRTELKRSVGAVQVLGLDDFRALLEAA